MNFVKTLLIAFLIVQLIAQNIVIKNTGCNSYDDKGNCKTCSMRFYKDSNNICQSVNPNCNTYN
jgi:hypothetical protein